MVNFKQDLLKRKEQVFFIILLIGNISVFFASVLFYFYDFIKMVYVGLFAQTFFMISLIYFLSTKKLQQSAYIFLISSAFATYFVVGVEEQNAQTSMLWFYAMIPTIYMFIQPLRYANIFNFIYMLGVVLIAVLSSFGIYGINFETLQFVLLILTYSMTSIYVALLVYILNVAYDNLSMQSEEIKNEKQKAVTLYETKNKLLEKLSIEIRTNISSILGFTNELKKEINSSKNQSYIKIIDHASQSTLELMNDAVDISKLETHKFVLEKNSFNFNDILIKLKNKFTNIAIVEKVKISFDFSEYDIAVVCDQVRLEQVISNIIYNSISMSSFSEVSVSVTSKLANDKLYVSFKIEDLGSSLPNDFLLAMQNNEKCFNCINNDWGFNILGISISKEILLLMGSNLYVKSEVGKGNSYEFNLELKCSFEPLDTNLTTSVLDEKVINILIAEDNLSLQKLFEIFFINDNVNISFAKNGKDALSSFKSNNFDLVLMDIMMPVMNGIESTKLIREYEKEKHLTLTPIIIITSNDYAVYKFECFDAGANEFINKPINEEVLKLKINKLFNS